jgi:serine protease AprX
MRFSFSHMVVLTLAIAAFRPAAAPAQALSGKVDPWVVETAAGGQTEFLVLLREQADLRGARMLATKAAKGAFVLDALRSTAERTQGPLLRLLAARGAEHRAFWVANMIWVRGGADLVAEVASREDVLHVYANPTVHLDGPVEGRPADEKSSPETIEWNVAKIHAPDVWNLGFTGQGVVVGGADTGYQWDHPALKSKYRGWNGAAANHNYNWHDAIHSGGGVCGSDAPAPCDDTDHGTHTMGSMVGDDGGSNQIGVAPGAKWIGCRNMDQGDGTPDRYSECFQWFIAPTNLAGSNPDPAKAPDVINNSWSCPPSEGCTDPTVLQAVVENTRAAGIEVVVSAGNSGSGCSTVDTPAAIYDASFTVGATDSTDTIAGFSSRGPVTVDGSNRLKPDVSAPGVAVRSSVPGNAYATFSGTSMAGPQVVGLVALLLSASPGLAGDPDSIEPLVAASAVPLTTAQACGGVPGSAIPNNTYGWGRVDALSAVQASNADLMIGQTDSPEPGLPGIPVTYTLTVTNLGPAAANDVQVSDGFPSGSAFVSATPSQGSCTNTAASASCDLGTIASGAAATVAVTVTPPSAGTILNTAGVSGGQPDPNAANNSSGEQTTILECPFPAPAITSPVSVPPESGDRTASVPASPGHTETWTLAGGMITAGQGTDEVTFTSGSAGTTMQIGVVDSLAGCDSPESSALISVDFLDVPPLHLFHDYVNTVARNGVTAGCGGGDYCPDSPVTRAQMAVFLLKAKQGSAFVPPACAGLFADVACPGGFAVDWIEELFNEGITSGCSGNDYCPDSPVTRAQMAVLLLKALLGAAYVPPAATGIFADVPPGSFAADWIEDLASRSITGGCGGGNYCPGAPNTRGQMAVFLVKTFGLE